MRVAEDLLKKNRKVSISEVAAELHLPEYALNKIFIKQSGITVLIFWKNIKSQIFKPKRTMRQPYVLVG